MSDTVDWLRCIEQEDQQALKAVFEITTPMLIGDGTQQAVDIRPPSIKGALRYWWRAVFWSDFVKDANNDDRKALVMLHAAEAVLFGSTATTCNRSKTECSLSNSAYGQGGFVISVKQSRFEPIVEDLRGYPGTQYLLGQGCSNNGRLSRSALKHSQRFSIQLIGKPGKNKLNSDQWDQLEDALVLWGLLGGLGSRSRRGIGSISLHELSGGRHKAPENFSMYKGLINKIINPDSLCQGLPPFTAFSAYSRIDVSITGNDAIKLMDNLGRQLQLYRSWGRNGKVHGQDSRRLFQDDHDSALDAIMRKKPVKPARRAVFGLPHHYYFSCNKGKLEVCLNQGNINRRGSPLFIHVHKFADGHVSLGVQSLIPARFLPSEGEVLHYKIKPDSSMDIPMTDEKIAWHVITDYMDDTYHFKHSKTILINRQPMR